MSGRRGGERLVMVEAGVWVGWLEVPANGGGGEGNGVGVWRGTGLGRRVGESLSEKWLGGEKRRRGIGGMMRLDSVVVVVEIEWRDHVYNE